jgi:uncharacterized protein (TIGR03083 family)
MSAPSRTKEFWLDAVRREGAAFRAAVGAASLTEPVPSCPDWTVRDLVGHLGAVYRWQRAHLIRGVISKPEDPAPKVPAADEGDLLAWWDEAFDQMVGSLRDIDPGMPAWNWSVQPPKAIFWHRRMAHETAIHRWDAQVSVGLPEPVETALAVDGIDEVLDSFLPAGRRKGPTHHRGVARLHASDAEAHWAVRIRSNGVSLLDTDSWFDSEPDAQAAAIGTASDLVLALWGRVPLTVLTLQGDPELVNALRTG